MYVEKACSRAQRRVLLFIYLSIYLSIYLFIHSFIWKRRGARMKQ